MSRGLFITLIVCCAGLAGKVTGQTTRTWTSNSDRRWSVNGNWSGNNRPDAASEIAQFGTGLQLNPELNTNSYTVRGLRFSAGAAAYDVGDDNGARTLKIGNATSGFIENLGASDQVVSIATLQFQSDATISAAGAGGLTLNSILIGTNRNLTFNAAGDIAVNGAIATGSGTVTKQGTGDLRLAGANSYSGTTVISAGAIVSEAAGVFSDTGRIDIAGGASLNLNNHAETIGRLTGSGTVDLGATGSGRLTLGSGASNFAGSFTGTGEIIVGAGATLTLGMDFSNSNLKITLAGGTLFLNGANIGVGTLSVTGNSVIDFSASADSTLQIAGVDFATGSLLLTAQNWTNAADYFYSQAGYGQGTPPLDQVQFQGWTTSDTKWQPYDNQITPVSEASTYGAWLLALTLTAGWWRRRRRA